MKYATHIRIALVLAFALALTACQQVTQGPAPLPEVSIGIAQFTQPRNTWDLLAGYIPEDQPLLEHDVLNNLDQAFETQLFKTTNRRFTSAGASTRCLELEVSKGTGSGTALNKWVDVGRCMNVDLLVVPQVLAWQDRDGGEMGTFHPAYVKLDFFLIDVNKERPIARVPFEETQESLANNLMNFGKFVERKGKWITALQLAEEGMKKAIKELGL